MRRSMEISLGVRGVNRVSSGIKRTAQEADQAAEAYDRQTAALERLSRALEGVSRFRMPGGGGGGGGGGFGGGSRGTGAGPLERFQSASSALRDDPEDFDSRDRFLRAQEALRRAQRRQEGRGFMDRLGDFVGTTRFGAGPGGQISPLVNRTLGLIGPQVARLAGPIGIAVAGLGMLGTAAEGSARRLKVEGEARMMSGGTARDIAALTGIFGLPAGDVAGAAARLRERVSIENADPYALDAARAIGLRPDFGRNFGGQNEAGMLREAFEKLRALGEGPEQLRRARQLEMDQFLPVINAPESQFRGMARQAEERERLLREGEPGAREYEAASRRFEGAWANRMDAISKPFRDFGVWFKTGIAEDLENPRIPFTNIRSRPEEPAAEATQRDLVKENTEATKELTRVLERGMQGAGPRAQSALHGLSGLALDEAIRAGAFRKGAWMNR